jgi:hypothetical protein
MLALVILLVALLRRDDRRLASAQCSTSEVEQGTSP